MVEQLRPLKSLDEREQAIYFHSRERRRSLAGVPELFRTHRFGDIPTASLPAAAFTQRDRLVTFWTSIRVTGATPQGLIFELGDATTAVAAWITDTTINLRAGDAGDDASLATYSQGGGLPDTLELDLVFAVRPGDGRTRIWGNGREIARQQAVNGQLPNGWAAGSDGAFAAAAQGALPADVTQTGAPSDFAVIQPLSVYVGQVPRQFV